MQLTSSCRATSLVIVAILASVPACLAQTPETQRNRPAFEIESIKPHEIVGGERGRGGYNMTRITSDPSMLRMQAVSAGEMIMFAWNVRIPQIKNAVSWLFEKSFDLSAKTSVPYTRLEQQAMLQDLLRRRFGLVCHNETIWGPVYELIRTPKFSAAKMRTAQQRWPASFRAFW